MSRRIHQGVGYMEAVEVTRVEATTTAEPWRLALRQLRQALRLDRRKAAELAGLSPETLRAYEVGRRAPSRETLLALLVALRASRRDRNRILTGAGFSGDGRAPGVEPARPDLSFDEAVADILASPWPACLCDDIATVLAANRPILRLWEAPEGWEDFEPVERNLFARLSDPSFGDRVANWDDVAAFAISTYKGHYGDNEIAAGTSPYVAAVVERFLAGDAAYTQRFAQAWAKTRPALRQRRFRYPVRWRTSAGACREYSVVVSMVNVADGLFTYDWIPVDSSDRG